MSINQLPQTPNVGPNTPNDLYKWLIEMGNRIRSLIDKANMAVAGDGSGDMTKAVYDTNDDGIVNSAAAAASVPWSGVSGKPSTYPPSTHNLVDTVNHPVSGLTTGHFLKATGAATYGFAAHGLTASDVGAIPVLSYIKIVDEKSSGTHDGTFTTGAWRTRVLNTIKNNDNDIASLANNRITLPAGTYIIKATAPAVAVDGHMCRLQNISDSTTLFTGTSEYSDGMYASSSRSYVSGKFTISASKVFELQHYCASTCNAFGLGIAVSISGVVETYAVVEIWKVA